jgi:hypothetical protein
MSNLEATNDIVAASALKPRLCSEQLAVHGLFVRVRGLVPTREQQTWGFRGVHLNPLGLFLDPPGPLLTHLHTVYIAYSDCLSMRLNPLAERTRFSQVLTVLVTMVAVALLLVAIIHAALAPVVMLLTAAAAANLVAAVYLFGGHLGRFRRGNFVTMPPHSRLYRESL